MDVVECETHIFHKDGRVNCKKTGRFTGACSNGYIKFWYQGRTQLVHRVIYEKFKGDIPEGLVINHINGKPTDNRIENLEVVSQHHNTQHREKNNNNTNGYKNIYWHTRYSKWCVKINNTHYGYFTDIQEAVERRDYIINQLNNEGNRYITQYPA
jgi:hypothetical protein